MHLLRITVNINSLSANPTKWSNTLKQFVGFCRRIVWVCLTILALGLFFSALKAAFQKIVHNMFLSSETLVLVVRLRWREYIGSWFVVPRYIGQRAWSLKQPQLSMRRLSMQEGSWNSCYCCKVFNSCGLRCWHGCDYTAAVRLECNYVWNLQQTTRYEMLEHKKRSN